MFNGPGCGSAPARLRTVKLTYCFDIDGTLCSNTDGEYKAAVPFLDVIDRVNRLFADGHQILLYTARGATTNIDWRELTERQLRDWGVNHHHLFMGKPTADVYIDDKALNFKDWKRSGFSTVLPWVEADTKAAGHE